MLHCFLKYSIFFIIIFLVFLSNKRRKTILWNLPIIGIIPHILLNFRSFHDSLAKSLHQRNGTVLVKRSLITPLDILVTCNPADVHFITTSSFSKFIKGPEWKKRTVVFGQHNAFNTDHDEWKLHRNTFRAILTHHQFQNLVAKIVPEIIDKGVIRVLDHFTMREEVLDLQELFSRYLFDFANVIAIGSNPNSLEIGFKPNALANALEDAWEAIFIRFLVPERLWSLLRVFKIGKESGMDEYGKVFDDELTEYISSKREEHTIKGDEERRFSMLDYYLGGPTPEENVMRDMTISMIFATRDTCSTALTWFFWLLSKNPRVEIKIREELNRNSINKCLDLADSRKFVYLHAALCETLRLYPPAAYQSRTPTEAQSLPSGHRVDENTMIVISPYAMARMESIWGEDCCEFKPERWIMENGEVKYVQVHKFPAFNAGPRICLGKDVAFILMKAVVSTIIRDYEVEVVENHPVRPALSIMFRMKHGLLAKVKRRFT